MYLNLSYYILSILHNKIPVLTNSVFMVLFGTFKVSLSFFMGVNPPVTMQ